MSILFLLFQSQVWYHDMYCHYEGIHQKKNISEIVKGEWAAPPITVQRRITGVFVPNRVRFDELCRDVITGQW